MTAPATLPAVAEIPEFRWHDLRHTFATRFTRVAGIKAAQNMLGHASVTTTAKYAHATENDLRAGLIRMEKEGLSVRKMRASPDMVPTRIGRASRRYGNN